MSTPDVPTEEMVTVGPLRGDGSTSSRGDAMDWFNTLMLIIGGIAALGFVAVMAGAYLIDNVPAILAGTIVILIAAIIWIIMAGYWMASIIKRRFIRDDKATRGVQQS